MLLKIINVYYLLIMFSVFLGIIKIRLPQKKTFLLYKNIVDYIGISLFIDTSISDTRVWSYVLDIKPMLFLYWICKKLLITKHCKAILLTWLIN